MIGIMQHSEVRRCSDVPVVFAAGARGPKGNTFASRPEQPQVPAACDARNRRSGCAAAALLCRIGQDQVPPTAKRHASMFQSRKVAIVVRVWRRACRAHVRTLLADSAMQIRYDASARTGPRTTSVWPPGVRFRPPPPGGERFEAGTGGA